MFPQSSDPIDFTVTSLPTVAPALDLHVLFPSPVQ